MFTELFGVGGAGFPGGFGQPVGDGLLVFAGPYACRVLRVRDLDGRPDERAQRSMDVEDGEEPFARCEIGAVEHPERRVRVESAQVFGDQLVLMP
ncbi:hypothetical protein [Streptomyces sp. NPDC060275]|uniref:hypothetical protein n=1 Tax=Streptomyces sp. NPDC060275 TaxID=3347090 RepID=UPI0036595FDA